MVQDIVQGKELLDKYPKAQARKTKQTDGVMLGLKTTCQWRLSTK